MSLSQEITFLNCKTIWFSKQNPTVGVTPAKPLSKHLVWSRNICLALGCHLCHSTEFHFHCSARTGSDQKGSSQTSLGWIPPRAQGKANSLEFCPSQGKIQHRTKARPNSQGFSILQSCEGCESQLLPREHRVSPAIPGLLQELQDQLLFTQKNNFLPKKF